MSEEILKALSQLFAIISKQDGGVSESERNFVIGFFQQELDMKSVDEYVTLYDGFADYGVKPKVIDDETKRKTKQGSTTVRESVRVLKICRKINKTLNQKQKVIVLVKLLEMLASDNAFTPSKMEIVSTVSDVFNILPEEYSLLEQFARINDSRELDFEEILVFDEEVPPQGSKRKHIDSGYLDGEIIFINVKSVGLYFTKYTGEDEISLNGKLVYKGNIVQFPPGSIFKTPKGAPLYYSDLVTKFTTGEQQHNISFKVEDLEFRFPNGAIGLRNVNLSESAGNLIGIMGASGAGKTTLLNVLAGLEKPYSGSVKINSYDIHKEEDKIEGVIGYIAQDDLLIEELTVYENLYYNAKLCFKNLSESEIDEKVRSVLVSLGLDRIADLKVGSVLNKKISGGQRKRLNIALELIREPAVMFVDEPTSGLSSRDSENVIDLLKELSLKGKLIFVVIHQPSSDIFKMFDKMWLMDTGGYPIFYGNPIEAVIYFKTASQQVGSDRGQCPTCGNVNPEQIFNIIEARVVDEYGEFTNKRKVNPQDWHALYKENIKLPAKPEVKETPPSTLNIPSKLKQTVIFTIRDFLSKISNTQYLFINLLEAPFLAVLLSLIIRYKIDADAEYTYRHNDNIPAYILICIIIALFMGLTVSAEEIIRDRKILKREAFLNLSRLSYLLSKIIILFGLSAVQTLSFVLLGNVILDIDGMNMVYWLVLFTISCHANVLGLNISSAFNSAVTVYILIPLLLIPQLILSGLIFDFDKLNNAISDRGKVPLLADFIASRWGYEALAVEQYKDNPYNRYLFGFEQKESENNYRNIYWLPKLEEVINSAITASQGSGNSLKLILSQNLELIYAELNDDLYFRENSGFDINRLASDDDIKVVLADLKKELNEASSFYNLRFISATDSKDSMIYVLKKGLEEKGRTLIDYQDEFYNNNLSDLVKAASAEERVTVHKNRIVQVIDPIYQMPNVLQHPLDYRTHFFAPFKQMFGKTYGTLLFNVIAIWFMTFVLYFTLYFEVLSKLLNALGGISSKLTKKS